MPANSTQPEAVDKRLRYFDGQFLKDQDFIDEQQYLIDRERRPLRLLHVQGVCEGLDVTASNKIVTVSEGTALDIKGRLIVLAELRKLDLTAATGQVDLYIAYHEEASNVTQASNSLDEHEIQGVKGATRWWERPKIEFLATNDPNIPADSLPLARIDLDNSTVVSDNRIYSGIHFPGSGDKPVTLQLDNYGAGPLALKGDLSVHGDITMTGKLTIPYPAPPENGILIGESKDLPENHYYACSVALQADAPVWPFGISKGGKPLAIIDNQGNLSVSGNIDNQGNLTVSGTVETGKLTIPYPAPYQNGILIGESKDLGTPLHHHACSIALQEDAPVWPFGICKAGQRIVVIDNQGNLSVSGKLTIPYPAPPENGILIGKSEDLPENHYYACSVALQADAPVWPFGISKGGKTLAYIDNEGNLRLAGNLKENFQFKT